MGLALGLGVGPPFSVTPVIWTPKNLPSLSLWLDAADASTITLNASTVSQWRDKSGNARHIAQATAVNQPTYNATGLNSLPTLSFDGADWLFNANPGALLRNVGGGSMTAVVSYPSVPAAAGVAVAVQTAVLSSRLNVNIQPTGLLSTGARRLDADAAVVSTASTAQALNTPVIHGTVANFTGNSLQLFTDGTGATATTYVSGGGNSSDTDAGTLLVGGASTDDGVTVGNPCTGSVSEVILTNSVISVADRQRIEGYLAWKWGGI